MKKALLLISLFSLVLMGASCERSYEWTPGDDGSDYDYSSGEYDSVPVAVIHAPTSVAVGEAFEVVATITHNADETQTLHSIDMGETYLEGVAITSSDPAFSQAYLLGDGTYSHTFMTDVPVDGLTITFDAVALQSGNWKGAFDVCLDDGLNCSFYTVSTYVE